MSIKTETGAPGQLCRLCATPITTAPIILTPNAECKRRSIIQQHYGIDVFGGAGGVDQQQQQPQQQQQQQQQHQQQQHHLCQQCWTTTEQFHELYNTVQNNEPTIWNGIRLAAQPDGEDAKPPSMLLELKMEASDHASDAGDDTFAAFDTSMPAASSSSSSSESSESSDSEAKAIVKRTAWPKRERSKKPVRPRKTKPRTTPSKPAVLAIKLPKKPLGRLQKGNHPSNDELLAQDTQIREYFQMHCDLCDSRFETINDAAQHYRDEHSRPGYLRCCGKKFFKRPLLLDHIAHHSDPKAFHCATCDRSYTSKASLKLHQMSHEVQLPKPHKCVVCGAMFAKYYQMTQHQRQQHLVTTSREFGCDICGKFFFSKWHVCIHIHSVHMAKHVCDICAATFKSRTQLSQHTKRVHTGETEPKIQCTICGAWLSNEKCLRQHLRRHDQPAVICTLCGKMTPNQNALVSHVRYVHGDKLFPCTMCSKSFKREIGLREHLATHTGVTLYTCPFCTYTCNSNANMSVHRKKSHPVEWASERLARVTGAKPA